MNCCTYRNEVLGIGVHLGHHLAPVLGRAGLEVVPLDGRSLGPLLLRGRSDDVEDLAQLVHLVLARNQRLPQEQLGEDAAAGPDVDRCCVGKAHEDFRTSVPEGDNLNIRLLLG